jgi:hypothetical protein
MTSLGIYEHSAFMYRERVSEKIENLKGSKVTKIRYQHTQIDVHKERESQD